MQHTQRVFSIKSDIIGSDVVIDWSVLTVDDIVTQRLEMLLSIIGTL